MLPTLVVSLPLPDVSVVMATHDRRALLEPAVRAVLADPATRELVVVVDGSTDGSLELLEDLAARDPRLQPMWIANRGESGAREAGVRAASHAVVLLLDDDVLACPGLVSGHAAHHRDREDLVVLGYMPVPERLQCEGGAPARLYAAWYEAQCRGYEAAPDSVLRGLWAGNVSLRREQALRVGLGNPAFDARYNPDRDFGLRLLEAGLHGRFDPALRAEHLYRRPLDAFLRDAHATGEGTWLVHALHPQELGPLPQDAYTRPLSPPLAAAVRFARRPRSRPAATLAAALARTAGRLRLQAVERRALTAAFCMIQQRASIERSRRAGVPA
jgi:glycosyltransferase involved in cell wall biosynthesis